MPLRTVFANPVTFVFSLVDQDKFHPCQRTIPLCVKTFANSTLPEEAQVSETVFKCHDKPAVSSQLTINSQSSSHHGQAVTPVILAGFCAMMSQFTCVYVHV